MVFDGFVGDPVQTQCLIPKALELISASDVVEHLLYVVPRRIRTNLKFVVRIAPQLLATGWCQMTTTCQLLGFHLANVKPCGSACKKNPVMGVIGV